MEQYVFPQFHFKDEVEPGRFNRVKTPLYPAAQPSVAPAFEPASEFTQRSGRRLVGVFSTEVQIVITLCLWESRQCVFLCNWNWSEADTVLTWSSEFQSGWCHCWCSAVHCSGFLSSISSRLFNKESPFGTWKNTVIYTLLDTASNKSEVKQMASLHVSNSVSRRHLEKRDWGSKRASDWEGRGLKWH